MAGAAHGVALALQWICFALSFCSFAFYSYKVYKKQCGWEVIYICIIESIKYILELWWEKSSPATLYICNKSHFDLHNQTTGEFYGGSLAVACGTDFVVAPWLRYGEWLLTCPVILIALSNLSGLKDDYNFRTMKLLSSDQGTIVMGVTAAYSTGGVKAAFFTLGVFYGMTTFYTAFLVYAEAYENVPAGKCQKLVSHMAWMFYLSWMLFPVMFLLGPEGAGHLDNDGSVIGHTFADLLSKNLWGIWSVFLREAVRAHHRKLWKEEQMQMQLGATAFEVPKEKRPDIHDAVNTFLAQQMGGDAMMLQERELRNAPVEKTVDPFYAEYRRKRRLRRGSLSGNPETDDGAFGQDEVDMMSQSGGSMTGSAMQMHREMSGMGHMNANSGMGAGSGAPRSQSPSTAADRAVGSAFYNNNGGA
eukprot:CAMPEP_0197575022 /NCGR_PEP_ID=MMETSP1326-20131121/568_1 /TAXON_ID=1155430 /ORGANISM="Genus nov. species nov., Strain RCC2288" /LENGTH=417 /DNA_ID=CAMNT_0043137715 /DNA_START=248 /DNA_END=1498 /DNA_ORIENTATION=-